MEFRSYNQELGISNLLFKRIFSNIQIDKKDSSGKIQTKTVKCIFDQRSRVFKNWQNSEKNGMYKLPMILINRTGYSKSSDRVNNMHNEVKYEITSKNRCQEIMTAVPIDINYEVSIISKDPSDIDQIASNFMIFFNSGIYVSCIHPKYDQIKLNNQIIMSDSISEQHPSELDGTIDDIIVTTFNFTFKTFLFAGRKQSKLIPRKIIQTQLSNILSNSIIELKPNEIDDFQKKYPNSCVSAILQLSTEAEITSYIDNPQISDQVYEEFFPIIKEIHTAWYGINNPSADFDTEISNIEKYPRADKFKDMLIWKLNNYSTNEFPDNIYPYLK